jgi:disulfide bond formation protein DsbB
MDVASLNYFLALGVAGMQVVAVVLIALFFMRKDPSFSVQVSYITRWAIPVAFTLSLSAALMALVHEHIFGLEPCYWCWWQRIFIFPQILMLGMTLLNEKYRVATVDFSIVASVIGAGISLYHHTLQMYPGVGLPCPATGPSCAQITFLEFGYITYPMMALSLFALTIVLMVFARDRKSSI